MRVQRGSDADRNEGKAASGESGGIVLTYDGKSVRSSTGVKAVNPMMLAPAKTFRITILGGWTNPDSDPKWGLITTRVAPIACCYFGNI